jgi:hypothetical protein
MTRPLRVLEPRLRDVAARICTEFHEMPGGRLTQAQVSRLWNLSARDCEEALNQLCESCRLALDPSDCKVLPRTARENLSGC